MFDSQGLDSWKRTAGSWRGSYISLMLCSTHKASTMNEKEKEMFDALLAAGKKSIVAVFPEEQEEAFWATWEAVKNADPSFVIPVEDWLDNLRGN